MCINSGPPRTRNVKAVQVQGEWKSKFRIRYRNLKTVINGQVRIVVIKAVTRKIIVFWDVTP